MARALNQVFRTESLAQGGTTISVLRGNSNDVLGNLTWTTPGSGILENVSTIGNTNAENWSSYISSAIQCTSNTGYVSTNITPMISNDYTIMTRVYIDELPPVGYAFLCNIGDITSGASGITVLVGSSGDILIVYQNVTAEFATGNPLSTTGTWYHFVFTRSSVDDKWRAYVDGSIVYTSSTNSYTVNGNQFTYLGFPGSDISLIGRTTDSVILGKVLTADQIANYANAPFI
jgi:hypothetical protein